MRKFTYIDYTQEFTHHSSMVWWAVSITPIMLLKILSSLLLTSALISPDLISQLSLIHSSVQDIFQSILHCMFFCIKFIWISRSGTTNSCYKNINFLEKSAFYSFSTKFLTLIRTFMNIIDQICQIIHVIIN